jgi:hypothetical protein
MYVPPLPNIYGDSLHLCLPHSSDHERVVSNILNDTWVIDELGMVYCPEKDILTYLLEWAATKKEDLTNFFYTHKLRELKTITKYMHGTLQEVIQALPKKYFKMAYEGELTNTPDSQPDDRAQDYLDYANDYDDEEDNSDE